MTSILLAVITLGTVCLFLPELGVFGEFLRYKLTIMWSTWKKRDNVPPPIDQDDPF